MFSLPRPIQFTTKGLLSQAGVAVGLAITSQNRFSKLSPKGEMLGNLAISVTTATTFIVQIFGPIGVKLAIKRAGEIGQVSIKHNGWAAE